MQSFVVDGRNVRSFADFIEAVNVGLVREIGGEWNGNLDALNDYLTWSEADSYELRILGSKNCMARLAHAAMAEKLSENLETCHPTNRASVATRLERARQGLAPTLFDVIQEIISDKQQVRLILS